MTQKIGDLFDLHGKTALVTGASKGIGAAMARAFAAFGGQVIVCSRKQEAVDAVAAEIKQSGGKAVAITANVGDTEGLETLVARAVEAFDGLDILVNNAAANPVYGPLEQTGGAAFNKIMTVNLRAPFELGKLILPHFMAAGGGSIINISSIGGLSPEPGLGLYSVSKAALISLTKVMAREWGPLGVRANVICPGLIKTKFSQALWKDEKTLKRFMRQLPLQRIGQPEDMMGAALFLASAAGAYTTGSVFCVDGGFTI